MSKHLEYSSPLPRFPGTGRICPALALAFVLIVQRALETHGKNPAGNAAHWQTSGNIKTTDNSIEF